MARRTREKQNSILEFRQQPQAYRALKRVVQIIRDKGLAPGDRLPVHQELAAMLDVSNDTLTTVMRELTRLGLVERRTRAGTIVADVNAVPPLVWSIGLASVPAGANGPCSFFAELTMRIQQEIARRNWRCTTYYRFNNDYPSRLSWFGPLCDDLNAGVLDALVSMAVLFPREWKTVRKVGVAGVQCAIGYQAPNAVLIDQSTMAGQAADLLMARKCRTIATVCVNLTDEPVGRFPDRLTEAVKTTCGQHARAEWITGYLSLAGGVRLAEDLLQRSAKKRPDGLIVLDDFIALGLTNRLAATGEYRPHIAVTTHQQLPLTFSLPVIRFATDIEDLAQRAVAKLQKHLLEPSIEGDIEWVPPRLVARKPQRTPPLVDSERDISADATT